MKSTKLENFLSVISGFCLIAITFVLYFMYPNYHNLIIPTAILIDVAYYFYFTSELGFTDSLKLLLLYILAIPALLTIIAINLFGTPFSLALVLKLLMFTTFTTPLAPILMAIAVNFSDFF